MALLWILLGVALSAQAVALIFWGHAAYLWIQGIEAAFASMLLVLWRVRFRARAPRATRWPPLAPLASLALAMLFLDRLAPDDFFIQHRSE